MKKEHNVTQIIRFLQYSFAITLLFLSIVNPLYALELSEVKVNFNGGYNLAQHYGDSKKAEGYKDKTGFYHGFTSGLICNVHSFQKVIKKTPIGVKFHSLG